jgi:uncharacterized protein HemX
VTGAIPPPPRTPPPPDESGHGGWLVAFAVIVALVLGAGIAAIIGHDDTPSTAKTTTLNVTQGTTVQAAPTVKVTTPAPTTVTVQAPTETKTVQAPARTQTSTAP